jgi:magnesium-transporting ATPase (P-type)
MTTLFVGIVVMQVANVFSCRSERYSAFKIGFFSNMRIYWGIAIALTFACTLIYVPFFQNVFNTISLGREEWGILFVLMVIIFFLEELRKNMSKNPSFPSK